jgi:hypothetical protein
MRVLAAVLLSTTAVLVPMRTTPAQQRGGTAPSVLATVTVDPTSLGSLIPADFVGFSLEVSTAGQGIGAFQGPGQQSPAGETAEDIVYALGRPEAPNTGYFRFMHNLGAGILRLGGNSQDNSCWDRAHSPHPEACDAELALGDLQLFSHAARASGWRLIVGINLKQNAPAWALSEVTDGIAKAIRPAEIFAIEPGNEPDLFGPPLRPREYSPADNVQDFVGYLHALAQSPIAKAYKVVGPATCCGWRNPKDLATFLDGVGATNLAWITVHNYSATTCRGQTVSMARLLSSALMDGFNAEAMPLAAVARAHHLPIAMAETNSASCGGMPGVSNAFASTLWGLDFTFSLVQDGFVNVDFHASYRPGGGSSYNPVDTYGRRDASGRWQYRNVAEPLYYGLYLFSQHAAGAHMVPVSLESDANVRAYAVSRCAGCAVDVFVLNKDTTAAGPIHVRLGRPMGKGTLLLVDAPSLGSLAPDVRYGGRQFASDGTIGTPETTAVTPGADGDYTFTLPNAAIALLTVEARGR